jgi:hypothetical protein
MELLEYLKARRLVEQADPQLVKEAERLANIVKTKHLPTVDLMWQELIKLADAPQKELFNIL